MERKSLNKSEELVLLLPPSKSASVKKPGLIRSSGVFLSDYLLVIVTAGPTFTGVKN